jgi:diacylglycerol kinase family enzyme
MASRVEVIVNSQARRLGESSALRRALVSAFEESGATVHATATLEELQAVANGIASREVDVVVLAGGDGATMRGVSALALAYEGRKLPRVALISAGTVGTIARNTGARGASRRTALRLAVALGEGRVAERVQATLRVRDDRGGDRVGFIFGAGLVSRFFELYDASRHRGHLHAAQIAARLFVGSLCGSALAERVLERQAGSLRVDEKAEVETSWSLILASVLPNVGLHLYAAYRARECPPRFHVVASGLGANALGRQMPRVLMGMPIRGKPGVDTLALSVDFTFGEDGSAYVLDGDVLHAKAVHLSPGPALTMVTI